MTRPESSRRGESCRIAIRSRLSSITGATFAGNSGFAWPGTAAHANGSRTPYRGIRCQNQCYLRLPAPPPQPDQASNGPVATMNGCGSSGLLSVVLQHLIAGLGQLGTILLQAGQNGEIALIDDRTAEALNVARTSRLLLRSSAALLLLGEGTGGKRQRQQGECYEKFLHRVPSSDGREFQPESHMASRDRLFRLQMPRTAATSDQKRWQMRPNLRRPASELRALQRRFDDAYK